jgi:RNA polymerase sigma-70 factor, ECF subfamily
MADSLTQAWRANRAHLMNIAYRILGDIGEAEDIVQEAFLRLARTPAGAIQDERGWLTVIVGRLCLDQVRSARARREQVPGSERVEAAVGIAPDPADRVTLDDEVKSALLVVLNRLSPAERVAFVMHDVFQTPFKEIALTLGKPVATCRQLAKRARQKIAEEPARPMHVGTMEHQAVTERFIIACSDGDLNALLDVLAPTVWGIAELIDSGMEPIVTVGPVAVSSSLLRYYGTEVTIVAHPLSAGTLLAFYRNAPYAIITLTIADGQVGKIEVSLDMTAAPKFPATRATGD